MPENKANRIYIYEDDPTFELLPDDLSHVAWHNKKETKGELNGHVVMLKNTFYVRKNLKEFIVFSDDGTRLTDDQKSQVNWGKNQNHTKGILNNREVISERNYHQRIKRRQPYVYADNGAELTEELAQVKWKNKRRFTGMLNNREVIPLDVYLIYQKHRDVSQNLQPAVQTPGGNHSFAEDLVDLDYNDPLIKTLLLQFQMESETIHEPAEANQSLPDPGNTTLKRKSHDSTNLFFKPLSPNPTEDNNHSNIFVALENEQEDLSSIETNKRKKQS